MTVFPFNPPVGATVHPVALALVASLLIATSVGARAADNRQKLEEVQRTLDDARARKESLSKRAETYAKEMSALKKRLVVAARRAQNHETKVSDLENRIAVLSAGMTRSSRNLKQRERQLLRILFALQRLSRHPPIALVTMPISPSDTVRSAILLRGAVPRLEAQATALRNDLRALSATRARIAMEQASLGAAGRDLDRERLELRGLINRKASLERKARIESSTTGARITELAAQSRDLQELIDRLAATRKRRDAKRSAARVSKQPVVTPESGRFPVAGSIFRKFGESEPTGLQSKGITIATRPAAQVVSPARGAVVFAGPFRGYGQLLIIEYGEGYRALLSGMSRLDAAVGDEVLEGEPVGVMKPWIGEKPTLYFELRRNGRPVNPLPWLASKKDKVSG